MTDESFNVLWHNDLSGYNQTEIEADEKPIPGEAAQIVAIQEDTDATTIRVDSVQPA